ncbi:MAG: hypothetical protein ED556_00695 [Winogradskyella sp.]|uniref:DUF6624 domain-containing protein n=1 Tax=Winogradskyella sp. TaxID=1883156 RepID=UPI000F3F2339|nr:DUF6624 domain-containing protein [Winogradskyella sp.]RNC87740.1 MAG: hypothetical protein ED556_00695 [Winogradskyella sp.]
MKKIVLLSIFGILLVNCNSNKKISEQDKVQILLELNAIRTLDQEYAGMPPENLREKYGNKKAWEIFELQQDSVDLINQEKIKSLYMKYGYLGEKKIGEDAASDFWLPIQHADNDVAFQKKMLKAIKKEIENGSKDKYRYAMLEDRINVNLNRPQRFGSQLTYNEKGQAIPRFGLIDSTVVDSLRKAYSMPSFKEYYNDMTIMHFELNKKYLAEQGITEPQLYE